MTTKKAKAPATGPANQMQIRFNEKANSDKVSETGFDFFWGNGLLGELNTAAVEIKQNRPIYVFNNSAAVEYVALSENSGMAAPANASQGIPLPAYSGIMLASGDNTFIRSSSADVYGYQADENITRT